MEVPENFRGMKKVKEYPNHVLYIDEYGRRECFQYYCICQVKNGPFYN